MIDLQKASLEFEQFINQFGREHSRVDLKYKHSLRVRDLCLEIAASLNLSEEEQQLAALAGLLHDVGRFPQAIKYQSFNDSKTVDHGDLGSQILFEQGLIRKFIDTNQYDDLLKKVVAAHNKIVVPKSYNEQERFYSNIVRDADKLDIFYIKNTIYKIKEVPDESITPVVLERIEQEKEVKDTSVRTVLDDLLGILAFVFNLEFDYSFKKLKALNYINQLVDDLPLTNTQTKQTMNNIKEKINKYVDHRIGGIKC